MNKTLCYNLYEEKRLKNESVEYANNQKLKLSLFMKKGAEILNMSLLDFLSYFMDYNKNNTNLEIKTIDFYEKKYMDTDKSFKFEDFILDIMCKSFVDKGIENDINNNTYYDERFNEELNKFLHEMN